jgi:ADP-ribosylglycohydrolase
MSTPYDWPIDRIPIPKPARPSVDRIRGMLLGVAIGDALGATSEGHTPATRRAKFGEIRSYLPNRHAGGEPVGLPTDDTQLTFWTLEGLLEHGKLDPQAMMKMFSSREIFGMGRTVGSALMSFKSSGDWRTSGEPSAGNGALMRISPTLLPHLAEPGPQLWKDVVAATVATHDDEMAVVSSVGFVGLLFACFAWSEAESPPPRWWRETFLTYSRAAESGKPYTPRSSHPDFEGTLSDFINELVVGELESTTPNVELFDTWYSGAYLLETVPCVLTLLARHGHDPEEAIVRAVNDTQDNDTAAAIVGAAVGALHGKQGFPGRWLDSLLGRTTASDDGRIFELIDQAIERFS